MRKAIHSEEERKERERIWNENRNKNKREKHKRMLEEKRKEREAKEKELFKKAKEAGKTSLYPPVGTTFQDPAVGLVAFENTEYRLRRIGPGLKYESPDQMIPVISEFFDYCIATNTPPLVTGLALALGFACRDTLDEYMKKPEFHDIIKRAKLVCENYAARGLITGRNTVGFIFLLKQYGWKDVQESIHTVETHEQRIERLLRQNTTGGG